jgi:uncharacterized protein (DUF952 family)
MKILHITENAAWKEAQSTGIYSADSLAEQGFIHCCLDNQLDQVLKKWYPQAHGLLLLEIDPERLDAKLVYENLEGGEELFPHIYGPLNLDAVVGTRAVADR